MSGIGAELFCHACRAGYSTSEPRWRCKCGGHLELRFEARIEPPMLSERRWGMWRYREAIPIGFDVEPVSLGEGATPLMMLEWGGRSVHVKLEMLFPTGSYKDRGASVMLSRVLELGIAKVVEDSSGNAGCAVAAYAAAAGINCEIFVPEGTSRAKLEQIRAYGATLRIVKGNREEAAQAAKNTASDDVYYASHVWDPFFLHGTKTLAYEIWEQLGGLTPDALIIPTGNGTLLLGAYIGFSDLRRLGLIRRLPRLVAVQAERCAPLMARYLEQELPDSWSETVAEGIAIAEPLRWEQVLASVWDTDGEVVTVSEQEILDARVQAGRKGLYLEPTSATALAALQHTHISPEACVVVPLTGTGLKSDAPK